MKNAAILLHLGEHWQRLEGDTLHLLDAAPRLDENTWIIDDFSAAPSGTLRIQGKAVHAAAVIERRMRAEGQVDGESHVLIHRQHPSGDGLQALYTAIPLTAWQQTNRWASDQKAHCLILPLLALATAGLENGEARLLQQGHQILYLSRTNNGYTYIQVTAYSDSVDDLLIALRSLTQQIRDQNRPGDPLPRTSWCPVLAHPETENSLRQTFTQTLGITVESCPQITLKSHEGTPLTSALPWLLTQCNIRDSINGGLQKLAAGVEQALPISILAIAILAAGLYGLSAYLHWDASIERDHALTLQQQARQRTQPIQTMLARSAPPDYAPTATFLNTLATQKTAYNPYVALSILRQAAGSDIHIQRLRLETSKEKNVSLVVDGSLDNLGDPSALNRFLQHLRDAGYQATPLDPADGGKSSGFTYRLESTGTSS
jgi:hypothetical protein